MKGGTFILLVSRAGSPRARFVVGKMSIAPKMSFLSRHVDVLYVIPVVLCGRGSAHAVRDWSGRRTLRVFAYQMALSLVSSPVACSLGSSSVGDALEATHHVF